MKSRKPPAATNARFRLHARVRTQSMILNSKAVCCC